MLGELLRDEVCQTLADARATLTSISTRSMQRRFARDEQVALYCRRYGRRPAWPREAEQAVRSMEDAITQIESERLEVQQLVDDLSRMAGITP